MQDQIHLNAEHVRRAFSLVTSLLAQTLGEVDRRAIAGGRILEKELSFARVVSKPSGWVMLNLTEIAAGGRAVPDTARVRAFFAGRAGSKATTSRPASPLLPARTSRSSAPGQWATRRKRRWKW